jgi:hypothetical protein
MPKQLTTYLQTGPDLDEPAFVLPVVNDIEQRAMEIFGPNKRLKVVFTLDSSPDARTPRGYYRAVVLPAFTLALTDLGNPGLDDDTVHEWIKDSLMGTPINPKYHPARRIVGPGNDPSYAPCSTAAIPDELTWWEFLNDLRMWAAENLSINIPDPIPARVRGGQTFPT